jgi:hypothetical protein
MDQGQNSSLFSMNLDAQNSYTLRSMASWAKVLGVVSFILAGLFVLWGIVFQQTMSRYDSEFSSYRRSGMSSSGLGGAGLAMYVIVGVIYGLSGLFAVNAGNKINGGLKNNDMEMLNGGFAGARNFFALWAILTIITLLILFIGLIAII